MLRYFTWKAYGVATLFFFTLATGYVLGLISTGHDACSEVVSTAASSRRKKESPKNGLGQGEVWCEHMCSSAVRSEMDTFDPSSGECTCK
jgi:hypothetical protein